MTICVYVPVSNGGGNSHRTHMLARRAKDAMVM